MNECEKYWFRVNKRHLIADCFGAAAFTAIGGGQLIAVIFYMMAVEICGMNYLFVLHFSGNDNDSLNLAKTLPVKRSEFYDTYIKMILLQSTVFAAVFALGTVTGSFLDLRIPLLPRAVFGSGTIVSNIGYYVLLTALVLTALIILISFTSSCSTIGRTMLPLATFYIAGVFQGFYFLLLALAKLSPRIELVYNIFAVLSFVALCIMTAIFVREVKHYRAKFVTT